MMNILYSPNEVIKRIKSIPDICEEVSKHGSLQEMMDFACFLENISKQIEPFYNKYVKHDLSDKEFIERLHELSEELTKDMK